MSPTTEQGYKERMLRVLVHIQRRLDDPLELVELARLAHFSPYHFHRIFRGMVGESVMEHVRRLRLERAAMRLKARDLPVTQIAFEAGYETHESFTRAFRTMFGIPPAQYRETHRIMPPPPVPSGVHFAADGAPSDFIPHRSKGAAMDVRVEDVPPTKVVFVRHIGPYQACGEAWGRLFSWAGPRGLVGPGARLLGVCYDDPSVTPPDKLRYDACLTITRDVAPEGAVGVQEIGGGRYAVTRHRGPYEKLGETYTRLCGEWMPAAGHEARSAPCMEHYLNSPMNTAPADLLTDIYMPIE